MSTSRLHACLGLALSIALAAAPEVANACSSCVSGAGDERTQVAYRVGALMFTALPLMFLGGFVWWIVRRSRALAAREPGRLAPAAVAHGAAFRTSSSR